MMTIFSRVSRTYRAVVILIFLLLATSAIQADPVEDKAVRFVEAVGGRIERDQKVDGNPVIKATLPDTAVTDETLKELAALKQLKALEINGAMVTDAGLKELAGLQHLQELHLFQSKVSDAGLKELAALKQLQHSS